LSPSRFLLPTPHAKEEQMSKKLLSVAAIGVLAASAAIAQQSAVTSAAGGAVTGAIVGGPVGAAVGRAVGAVAGIAIDPPPERVVTYISQAPLPADSVASKKNVVVGAPLPETVIVQPIRKNLATPTRSSMSNASSLSHRRERLSRS
jgi:hypothetical protein